MSTPNTPHQEGRLAKRQLTTEEAIALAQSGWWEGVQPEVIAQFQLSQEKLCMDFGAFHVAVEAALHRPVWTHEFAQLDLLWMELHEQRTPPSFAEICALVPADKLLILQITPQNEGASHAP